MCLFLSLYAPPLQLAPPVSSYKERMKMYTGDEADNRSLPYLRLPSETVRTCREVLELDPNLAKPLLLLMRFGSMPSNENSTLAKRVTPAIQAIVGSTLGHTTTVSDTYRQLVFRLSSRLCDMFDPVVRGAVIQMCETVRLPEEFEIQRRSEALWKEVSTLRRVVPERPTLNWNALWDGGQLIHGTDMMPWTVPDIKYATDTALRIYHQKVLYPSMSRKLLPTRARKWLAERGNMGFEDAEIATPAELEKLYIVHGVHALGPCELKQRWYMHGLVPRTYAVAGETAYTFSKYLKEVWDILWNSFIPTERFNRVDVSRIRRSSAKYSFAMYDLSTFTSNLETHRDFVLSLARNMNVEVTVANGREGFVEMSLRSLLQDYADYLCREVWWYTELKELHDIPEEVHAVAGLLGVIGNIASCGVAHGMFLRSLVEDLKHEGVAGDDAIFVYLIERGWRHTTDRIRGNLGDLADDKVYDLEEGDAVYLKRGLEEESGILKLSDYVFFPKLIFLSKNDLKRYRESNEIEFNKNALERIFVSSLGSTFRSAGRLEFDMLPLKTLLVEMYDILGLPILGHCPGIAQSQHVPVWAEDLFVPGVERLGDPEYVRRQYLDFFDGEGRFPETELEFDPVNFEVEPGSVFRAKGSKALTYLYRLGILRREKVMIEVSGFMAAEKLISLTGRKTSGVYEYTVSDSVLLSFVHKDLRTVRGCPISGVCYESLDVYMLTSGTQCGLHRYEYGEVNAVSFEQLSDDDLSSTYSIEEGEILS